MPGCAEAGLQLRSSSPHARGHRKVTHKDECEPERGPPSRGRGVPITSGTSDCPVPAKPARRVQRRPWSRRPKSGESSTATIVSRPTPSQTERMTTQFSRQPVAGSSRTIREWRSQRFIDFSCYPTIAAAATLDTSGSYTSCHYHMDSNLWCRRPRVVRSIAGVIAQCRNASWAGVDWKCRPSVSAAWVSASATACREPRRGQAVIHAAVDGGVTFFDTAEIYGPFTNEDSSAKRLLRSRAGGHRHEIRVHGSRREAGRPQQPSRAHTRSRRSVAQAAQDRTDRFLLSAPG